VSANRPSRAAFKLRKIRLEELLAPHDLKSPAAKARFLGVDPASYHRIVVEDGDSRPGPSFVGAVLRALPGVSFEYLFEIEDA
jgi:hypothetical protein